MSHDPLASVTARWLPEAQFCETHERAVAGAPEAILDAIEALDDQDDPLIRLLLQLREAPSRVWGALGGRSGLAGQPRFGLQAFTRLHRDADTLVFGLTGRFWRLDFGLVPIATPEAFKAFQAPGVAQLVMVYAVRADASGAQTVVTQTAVRCPDRMSYLLFTPYWLAIRLASGFIRKRILALVRRKLSQSAHPHQ